MVDIAPRFAPAAASDDLVESPRSWSAGTIEFCRRHPLGTVGLALVLGMAVAGLAAEWIAPYSPTANDFAAMTEPPNWSVPMRCAQLGGSIMAAKSFAIGL